MGETRPSDVGRARGQLTVYNHDLGALEQVSKLLRGLNIDCGRHGDWVNATNWVRLGQQWKSQRRNDVDVDGVRSTGRDHGEESAPPINCGGRCPIELPGASMNAPGYCLKRLSVICNQHFTPSLVIGFSPFQLGQQQYFGILRL